MYRNQKSNFSAKLACVGNIGSKRKQETTHHWRHINVLGDPKNADKLPKYKNKVSHYEGIIATLQKNYEPFKKREQQQKVQQQLNDQMKQSPVIQYDPLTWMFYQTDEKCQKIDKNVFGKSLFAGFLSEPHPFEKA